MLDVAFETWAERTLGGVGLFRDVDTEILLRLGQVAAWRRFRPGDALLRVDDRRTSCFVLQRGLVRVRYDDGRVEELAEPGTALALRTAFRVGPSRADLTAVTEVDVAEFRRCTLLDAMTVSPALAGNVARLLSARGAAENPRRELDTRVMQALRQEAPARSRAGGWVRLGRPVAPALWATLLGVDRREVERALARLERQGVVQRRPDGRHVVERDELDRRLR